MNQHPPYSNLNYYQNANAEAQDVKDGFLIRLQEYDIITNDMLRNPMENSGSVQHYLILGKRGSGKSTLLKRLQIEVDTNKKLTKTYIAINTAEEQANVYKLYDLLEQILHELEDRNMPVDWPGEEEDEHDYTRKLFASLHKALERSGKRVILLLDNIDRIFENLRDEDTLLREYLLNYKDIKIIGASTRLTEHFWEYNKPFYEFFRTMELKPLNSEEVKKLLLSWSEKENLPALKAFVENRPGQLEMVRVLTDGLPRTLQFFVNILLSQGEETGYEYLRLLMDRVTPLYQERLNNLPPSQRKIVLQMAFLWESVGAKELAKATKMENRVISAQLNQLVDKGVAEKIETNTKNHLYRLSERFFNLWLIFTQGGPREKRRAKYLTIFLENFYDEKEIEGLAQAHLEAVKGKRISAGKAVLLTKAYSQSKYISLLTHASLIASTSALPDISEELKKELPDSAIKTMITALTLINKKEWDNAFSLLQTVQQEDALKQSILGQLFFAKNDWNMAEKYYLIAYQKGMNDSSFALGLVFFAKGDYESAEKYLLEAVKYKNSKAAVILSSVYYMFNKNRDEVSRLLSNVETSLLEEMRLLSVLPGIKAWAGNFTNLEQDLLSLARQKDQLLDTTLNELLVHHQINLVEKLFNSEEFGQELIEKYLPLYHVSRLLSRNKPEVDIKIPPEIKDVVNGLMQSIQKRREFYYGRPE
ncbi:MAG TPA: AAA family ATPase [Puia sp.]|jgi:hypothetical protein|nr:AAA family ATPase [Puia sp.]